MSAAYLAHLTYCGGVLAIGVVVVRMGGVVAPTLAGGVVAAAMAVEYRGRS